MKLGLNIDRKRFLLVTGMEIALFAMIITTFLRVGVALAYFPISGIGGFTVTADQISAGDFTLYPMVGSTSEKENVPQTALKIGEATISGLHLTKELPVPIAGKKAKLMISSSGNVKGSGLLIGATTVLADSASFDGLDVNEHYGDYNKDGKVDATDKIELKTPKAAMSGATIEANSLFATTIYIPGIKLNLKFE